MLRERFGMSEPPSPDSRMVVLEDHRLYRQSRSAETMTPTPQRTAYCGDSAQQDGHERDGQRRSTDSQQ